MHSSVADSLSGIHIAWAPSSIWTKYNVMAVLPVSERRPRYPGTVEMLLVLGWDSTTMRNNSSTTLLLMIS